MVKRSQYVEYEKSYERKTTPGFIFDATCSQEVKIGTISASDQNSNNSFLRNEFSKFLKRRYLQRGLKSIIKRKNKN